MDESTPLNSANGNGNGANRLPTSNKNWKIVRDNHNMEATFKFTWSERQLALREKGVGQAAHLCRDAVFGYQDAPYEGFYDPYGEINRNNATRNEISVLCGRLVVILRGAVLLTNWVLFFLVFVEPPYWCRNGDNKLYGDCKTIFELVGTTADGEKDKYLYPTSGVLLLTVRQSISIELLCLLFNAVYLFISFADDGFSTKHFFYKGYKRLTHASQIILISCIFIGINANTVYNPLFRLILLATYLRNFQREFQTFLKMIPPIMNVLMILAVITIFYAWFGVVLFNQTDQGKEAFPTLMEGVWSLWIMVTTANYPDVMMPAYNDNRVMALFFISYMLFSFFYLMNLVLAVACNSYDESIAGRRKYREDLAKELLTKAFELLDPEKKGSISKETVMNVMLILNQDVPEIHRLTSDEKSIFFALMDKDGSSMIDLDEFLGISNILMLDLKLADEYITFIEAYVPSIYRSQWYQRFCNVVKSHNFEVFVDVILVLNAAIIAIQDYPLLSGEEVEINQKFYNGHIDTIWEALEALFTVLYAIEALLKITVYGWKKYSESGRNLYDFVITILAVFASFYVYIPNDFSNSNLIRIIVMARVLRLGRLLFAMESFRVIGAISVDIIPAATSVFTVLLFISYFFSWLGNVAFGGLISRDPMDPVAFVLLEAEDFVSNDYWANNFNDMLSGMNVLFNLIVVNNWTECAEGFEYVTGQKWVVRAFFFCFHVLTVVGISNVVTSFIINAFFQQMKTIEQRKGRRESIDGEAVIIGSEAIFDSSKITGTETGVKNKYIARIKPQHLDVEMDERSALRHLFTQTSSTILGPEKKTSSSMPTTEEK